MSYSVNCAQGRSNLFANVLYMTFPVHVLVDVHTKRFVDDTCFTGWSFILKEGISRNVDNFCLDATSMNSIFVKFKVSLLADSHVYTLFKS